MAKRSPILGYNHNVRYRGLVFHVQTEDSGLLNPHLFTHLFYEGVIVSTRKLVYDAGSNEEAIKALMQAQHKAVMKDLRRGAFDEKIDQYLGGTPGLEPRAGGVAAAVPPAARGERAPTEQSPPPEAVIAAAQAAMSISSGSPVEIMSEGLSEPIELPRKARTDSADRTTRVPRIPDPPRQTAQRVAVQPPRQVDSAIIEISVEEDSDHSRVPRDTAVEAAFELRVEAPSPARNARPASHGAATLPAMKPPSRPQISPPIITRPAPERTRSPDDSVPIEIHSPAPPSVEPPPGERGERPGQYSVNRKDGSAPLREKTGRIPVISPAAGTRADRGSGAIPVVPAPQTKTPTPPSTPRPSIPALVPPTRPATPVSGTPQAHRVHATAPIMNRTPAPTPPAASSGVVMTRPAVIVGAPPKQGATQSRIRKAREEESRGFGQGLISEKSLDEVILAYLSEDGDDK